MTTYRLYLESRMTGLTETLPLKREAEFASDGEARAAFMPDIMASFADAYSVSVTIKKIVDGKEEKVL